MALEVNGVTLSIGDTGIYYDTDGNSYPAKVVLLQEADPDYLQVPANSGVGVVPEKRVDILILGKGYQANMFRANVFVTDQPGHPHSFVKN